MGDQTQTLLNQNKAFSRCVSHVHDELHTFRTCLKWLCVDQSDACSTCLSWFVFLVFAIVVPAVSHFVLSCTDCDTRHTRPYDSVAQLSLSVVAAISFLSLSTFVRRYGLRRFLFFDKLRDESETVRKCYKEQLNRSLKILFIFVLPCFAAETVYEIWWYTSVGARIPFVKNVVVSNTIACILDLYSWFYRTVVFFLVCVLFRLLCHLQILRMQDFALVFQGHSDIESVLMEHLRIRRHLRIISHRYRAFILCGLISITASQLACLLITTRPNAHIDVFNSGELALCSVTLVAGLLILVRSAARITHKAQSVTSLAAKWHVCATIDSYDSLEGETPVAEVPEGQESGENSSASFDFDDVGDEEDEVDNTKFIPSYAQSTISFQRRQALATYFENNRAGISVYGFMLDRTSLRIIFKLELTLVLWLLGKTIGKTIAMSD